MSISSGMTTPRTVEYIDPEFNDPLYSCLLLSPRGPVLFFAGAWCVHTLHQIGLPAEEVYWGPPSQNLGFRLITNRTVVVWPVACRDVLDFHKKRYGMTFKEAIQALGAWRTHNDGSC
jgi:hypothetical protein